MAKKAKKAKRKRYVLHVVPAIENGWWIKREGVDGTLAWIRIKAEAVLRARRMAHANQPSQVIVHKRNGVIQTEWTYGGDPRRFPG